MGTFGPRAYTKVKNHLVLCLSVVCISVMIFILAETIGMALFWFQSQEPSNKNSLNTSYRENQSLGLLNKLSYLMGVCISMINSAF